MSTTGGSTTRSSLGPTEIRTAPPKSDTASITPQLLRPAIRVPRARRQTRRLPPPLSPSSSARLDPSSSRAHAILGEHRLPTSYALPRIREALTQAPPSPRLAQHRLHQHDPISTIASVPHAHPAPPHLTLVNASTCPTCSSTASLETRRRAWGRDCTISSPHLTRHTARASHPTPLSSQLLSAPLPSSSLTTGFSSLHTSTDEAVEAHAPFSRE
ncbi:hypothetical protein R3P38DRAFT_3181871 [Favolaschia claudopus]|uniref:Uncharacterized protein n=1 Tax=Favolaschia claudopus TaxID=2862362 RepID=A0AAW0CKF4_9AGAR